MKFFDLCSTGAQASVLAFGGASMMGFHDRATSRRALDTAWDRGITLFDLARSYGYGQAEALFGQFARGKRSQLLIATKFGIDPDPSLRANAIRLLRGGVRGLRHLRWRTHPGPDRDDAFSQHWSPVRLQSSLYRSLRELGTDHVDLLLLHSPPADITRRSDLFEALDRFVEQGALRSFGLSTDPARGLSALEQARGTGREIGAVQYPYCILTAHTDIIAHPPSTVILNHVFGGRGGLERAPGLIASIRETPDMPPSLLDKLDGMAPVAVLADILINGALAATHAQCAVVSMFTPAHIVQNCAVAGHSHFSNQELRVLVSALAAHAAAPSRART